MLKEHYFDVIFIVGAVIMLSSAIIKYGSIMVKLKLCSILLFDLSTFLLLAVITPIMALCMTIILYFKHGMNVDVIDTVIHIMTLVGIVYVVEWINVLLLALSIRFAVDSKEKYCKAEFSKMCSSLKLNYSPEEVISKWHKFLKAWHIPFNISGFLLGKYHLSRSLRELLEASD